MFPTDYIREKLLRDRITELEAQLERERCLFEIEKSTHGHDLRKLEVCQKELAKITGLSEDILHERPATGS